MLLMTLQRMRSDHQRSVGTLTCLHRSFTVLEGASIPMRKQVPQRVPPGQYRVTELFNSLVIKDRNDKAVEIVTHDPGPGDILLGLSMDGNIMRECQEAMDILLPMVSRVLNLKQPVLLEIRNEASL